MSNGVEHVPGRCGGRAVLVGTRMPIWCLSRMSIEQIRSAYPHLTEQQIHDGRLYAAEHTEEMAQDIADQESECMCDRSGTCSACVAKQTAKRGA
jgi:uncharacterized protein (DUF433 family)